MTRNNTLMQETVPLPHFFYLAPIRGVTDALFRRVYHHHFPYFDSAVAPFINPQKFANLKDKFLFDVLPENNTTLDVVPQLLYNTSDDFIHLAKRLEEMGYTHINWNLGCPAPMVANKKRGSGLLPHSDRIVALLEEVIPALKAELSIKTRLGFHEPVDLHRLLPLLEPFPIREIIIHPRIGKQLYRGSVNMEDFAKCRELTHHKIVYNGDICRKDDFTRLSGEYPYVTSWMIGRGALADPFLLADIRDIVVDSDIRIEKIYDFHAEIYSQLRSKLSGPSHLLNRMKQIWMYLIGSFPGKIKVLKKIQKASSEEKYNNAVKEIFDVQLRA